MPGLRMPLHLESLAQHVDRCAGGEKVQGDAGDESSVFSPTAKRMKISARINDPAIPAQDADKPVMKGVGTPHGAERSGEHHALHGNIEHPA